MLVSFLLLDQKVEYRASVSVPFMLCMQYLQLMFSLVRDHSAVHFQTFKRKYDVLANLNV